MEHGQSIGRLRPDVVALLWDVTPADLCRLRAWGYRHLARELFVRDGARGVQVAQASWQIARLGGSSVVKASGPLPSGTLSPGKR